MAMCSIVDTIGIVNSVVPIAEVISRKLYVLLWKVVENGGDAIGGKPCPIVPEKLCLLFALHTQRVKGIFPLPTWDLSFNNASKSWDKNKPFKQKKIILYRNHRITLNFVPRNEYYN